MSSCPACRGWKSRIPLKADDTTRDIQIIATTAYALSDDEAKTLENGCDAYMAKPIAITEFLELIKSLMAGSHRAAPSVV
jgi:CheY-like chemotaxis protein